MKIKSSILVSVVLLGISFNMWSQNSKSISITQPGQFALGCNYWASHAGTNMWKDWRPDVVEADLKQISESGMQIIRVFPIWPDFQPIVQYYSSDGSLKEIRFKDGPLPGSGPGKDGMSLEMLEHFRQFADLAQKYNIKLVVGLVTGWMSGQLFVPQALEVRESPVWRIR